jgi:hypothetical protein
VPPHAYVPQSLPYAHPGPARAKSSLFVPVVLSAAALFFGSCAAFVGYAVYEAQTPEGKAKIAAQEKKDHDDMAAATAVLAAALRAVPAPDAQALACPAGTDATRAPVVDVAYLRRVVDGAADPTLEAQSDALESVRDTIFAPPLLALHDAGTSPKLGRYAASKLLESSLLVVLDLTSLEPARVSSGEFEGGALEGRVVVVDRASGRALCHASVSAESSPSVEYGGGVRLKVRGVPTPAMGKKSLEDAVAKDFATNVKAAVDASLRSMGARS